MKKYKLFLLLVFSSQILLAQRYLDEIFTEVTVTEEVEYGINASVLYDNIIEPLLPQSLVMDIYEPAGDTETNRPVVIIFHNSLFLPPMFNGGCNGAIDDADVVELAKRLARMGYVACAADYRLGWNPFHNEIVMRQAMFFNAIYRGIQDSRTAVKFLKRSIMEFGNPYGIDENKIAMWGFGTGAYITYGSATLNDVSDTWIPKFEFPGVGPMVTGDINGDLNADNVGIVPADYYLGYSQGDTMCFPNHVGYDASFQLAVQMGGACGDTSWVSPGDVPMISAHVLSDPLAPCGIGGIMVPPPFVYLGLEMAGACEIIPLAVEQGVNDIFGNYYFDELSFYVASLNGGIQGFFPFYSNDPQESSPWGFSYSAEPYGVEGSDCNTDQAGASEVMDSMVQYFAPRACMALDLYCTVDNVNLLKDNQIGLSLVPNPASDHINFSTESALIESFYVYDLTGKLVTTHFNINSDHFTLYKGTLSEGMYMALLRFKEGYIRKKIVFGN